MGFWLGIVLGMTVITALDLWTLRTIECLRRPRAWRVAAIALLIVGAVVGAWLGFYFTYPAGEHQQLRGIPFPVAVLELENGRWIEKETPNDLRGVLNVYIITICSLFPVSAATLLRYLMRTENQKCDGE